MAFSDGKQKSCKGNAMLEFALMAPLVAGLFFGILQTGFYGLAFISVENAARSAAMHNPFGEDSAADQPAACTIVTEELAAILRSSGGMPSPGCNAAPLVVESKLCGGSVPCYGTLSSPDGAPATAVTVRLTMPTWLPVRFLSEISRTAQMKVRQRQ